MLLNRDLTNLQQSTQKEEEQSSESVVSKFVCELIESQREDAEIVESLEQYYNKLSQNSDQEILRIKEQLEIQKALSRELEADEVVLPAVDLDDLSNFFIDCTFEMRKSLRHQLLTMKTKQNNSSSAQ